MKPRLLDLFCGAGGAAMGYHRAGFDVVGVDNRPQPNYPFEFYEDDAVAFLKGYLLGKDEDPRGLPFDAIHASPPCQAYSSMSRMWNAQEHPDLVAPTRELLRQSGRPYVIENVIGAPLLQPATICGAAVGCGTATYDLARHRLFETNFPILVPPCAHGARPIMGIYGDNSPLYSRRGPKSAKPYDARMPVAEGIPAAREAMGMPWATWRELTQAIPPAYTELIGHQLLQHLRVAA